MEQCITPNKNPNSEEIKPFPERLHSVPPRIVSGSVSGVSAEAFLEDDKQWKKHVNAYRKTIPILDSGRYRNIMDMNAGFGGFAAALQSPKLWVMNVVPTIAKKNTLGVVYERGLVGIYHDWYVFFVHCFLSTLSSTLNYTNIFGATTIYSDNDSLLKFPFQV